MLRRFSRLALSLLLAFLAVSGVRTVYQYDGQNIFLRPLQLDPAHPGKRRLGELIFLNAWELQSDNENFGGISALAALPENRFVGVSDAGTLIGFGLSQNDSIDRPFIAALPDAIGGNVDYADRDSEGITYDPQSGRGWISYEGKHAVRRFSPSFARVEAKAQPKAMADWPNNSGAEAIVRLSDGRFLVFSEGAKHGEGIYAAILFSGDPTETGTVAREFSYRPPLGFKPTDAAQLPDGRLIVLHRKVALPYGLFATKLSIVDVADIRPNALISGTVIATLAAPLLVDNMEGIAVTREGRDTIIWLISDDNFTILQRTLLMKFRLSERSTKKKPEAVAAPGFESL